MPPLASVEGLPQLMTKIKQKSVQECKATKTFCKVHEAIIKPPANQLSYCRLSKALNLLECSLSHVSSR